MKAKAADFLVYDRESGTYREDPEQAVRDDRLSATTWKSITGAMWDRRSSKTGGCI